MQIAVEMVIGAAALAGIVALEARDLRTSLAALALAGIGLIVALFLLGAIEVGIATIMALPVVVGLVTWALRRTENRDATAGVRLDGNGLLTLAALLAFAALFLLVVIPLLGPDWLPGVPPQLDEGPSSVAIVREVLVLLAAGVAVWAMARTVGRRNR